MSGVRRRRHRCSHQHETCRSYVDAEEAEV